MGAVERSMGLVGNVAVKYPCRLATTASLGANMAGLPLIDGVQTVAGDRILRKDEADGALNGIWVADTGTWDRSHDFDGLYDCADGTLIIVTHGAANARQVFQLTTPDPITIGQTALAFAGYNALTFPAALAGSGGSALVGFTQAGAGALTRPAEAKLREVQVSAADFVGFDATGATDSSAAINTALGNLPPGSKLYIPGPKPKFNITVNQTGITLIGPGNGGGSQVFDASMQRWEPFNPALPVVQAGNNTKVVTNVGLRDVTFYGASAGVGAVLFGSGAYCCSMDDTLHAGFTTYNVKCQGGNFPSSLIRINNCEMPGCAHVGIDMLPAFGSSYTSAIYIDRTHMSLGVGGIGIRNDGVTAFSTESYIDTPTGAISVQHLKTTATSPFLYCANLILDCTGTGITLDNTYSADLILSNHIRGSVITLGLVRNNVGATVPQYANTAMSSFYPNLLNPLVSGFMAFVDTSLPGYGADQSAGISAAGALGVRDMTIRGHTITLISGTGVYAIRDATGAKVCLISIDANGQMTIDPTPGQPIKLTNLAGVGSRAVVASATGVLSAP